MNGGGDEAHIGRRSRNFFRSGELHLVIMALLAEAPRHGYELMAELQHRFGGAYRPSPGSVYPALSALQAERLVLGEDDGDRRVYRLSPPGREALEGRRVLLASIEARTGVRLGPDDAEALLAQFIRSVRAGVKEIGLEQVRAVLARAQDQIDARVKEGRESR